MDTVGFPRWAVFAPSTVSCVCVRPYGGGRGVGLKEGCAEEGDGGKGGDRGEDSKGGMVKRR